MFDRCGVGSGLSWPVSYNYMYLSGFENTPAKWEIDVMVMFLKSN